MNDFIKLGNLVIRLDTIKLVSLDPKAASDTQFEQVTITFMDDKELSFQGEQADKLGEFFTKSSVVTNLSLPPLDPEEFLNIFDFSEEDRDEGTEAKDILELTEDAWNALQQEEDPTALVNELIYQHYRIKPKGDRHNPAASNHPFWTRLHLGL